MRGADRYFITSQRSPQRFPSPANLCLSAHDIFDDDAFVFCVYFAALMSCESFEERSLTFLPKPKVMPFLDQIFNAYFYEFIILLQGQIFRYLLTSPLTLTHLTNIHICVSLSFFS